MKWDAIIIGSGFGGVMAALPLVRAGLRVLMLERGGWVTRGPYNWTTQDVGLASPYHSKQAPYALHDGRKRRELGSWHCVGGQSVFYGGASYRYRETDFAHRDEIVGDSGAEWPFGYDDLEPHYVRAEQLLGVSGEPTPSDGKRSQPFPVAPTELSATSLRVAAAAKAAGMTPSRIPIAINFNGNKEGAPCVKCGTCDGYPCAIEAKNDLATGLIPQLIRDGMTLHTDTVVTRLVHSDSHISAVECIDRNANTRVEYSADTVIVAAGTLATPHLLLASRLDVVSAAGGAVGRYLTRHKNAVCFGLFLRRPNPGRAFDKQIAILDLYDTYGSLQQLTPPTELVKLQLPGPLGAIGARVIAHSLGLLAIAEDQPQRENGVSVDWSHMDMYGMPRLNITHRYSKRDDHALESLLRAARRVLAKAGTRLTYLYRIEGFSHALGTVRMGRDPHTSPLDADGRFRGLHNLYVTDGSALPRSGALNPSLTIAANALRVGSLIAGDPAEGHGSTPHSKAVQHISLTRKQ